ncbi:hypothetical protein BBP40_011050 [Aspergillus hancockii]|nr:hypothetical protein BBP40_011050 [Aspergillus hancockii]
MDSDLEKRPNTSNEAKEIRKSVDFGNSSLRPCSVRTFSREGQDSGGASTPRRRSSSLPSCWSGSLQRCPSPSRLAKIPLDPKEPELWAINHHRPNLIAELVPPTETYLQRWLGAKNLASPERRFRISFAELQRMRVRKLQCILTKHVIKMRSDGLEPPSWEDTLDKYTWLVKALKDYDYMAKCSQLPRDPFLVSGEYCVDNYIFERCMPEELQEATFEKVSSIGAWDTEDARPTPICGTRNDNQHKTWVRKFQTRVEIAGVGGAFLIAPMWLMVLHHTVYTCLISTTVFVVAFGLIMAFYLQENRDVLASTAAYAAVLVVFVGTSNSNSA